MEITTQVLHNMKTIKFAGWGESMEEKINEKRTKELKMLRKKQKMHMVNHVSYQLIPFLVSVSSFGIYLSQGHKLTPSIAFTTIMMFNIMRGPLNSLPWIISFFIDTFVSMTRIQEFLEQDDIDTKMISSEEENKYQMSLEINNANFAWKTEREEKKKKDEDKKKAK